MLPTSTKVPDRFTPDGADITYLIQVPDLVAKARYRRAMKSIGGRIWPRSVMAGAAKDEIEAASPENAAALLAICERYTQMSDDLPDGEKQEIVTVWMELSRVLHGSGGGFAAMVADNEFWMEISPLIATRCFLIGTDSLALKRGPDGLIPAQTLESAVPVDHIGPIGWRALSLFEPTEAETKNSASPQPSPSGPVSSTAASALPTEANGTSSESTTSAIQN
jgi:hypothetical protein